MRTVSGITVIAIMMSIASAYAQGPLAPSGAPGSTMKTLEQIEPRIPISTVPYTINEPGSYYLTMNLTAGAGENGIFLTASDVTVDLGGFTLTGSGADSGYGILQNSDVSRLRVVNGYLKNWLHDSVSAIQADGPLNHVENVHVFSNFNGISVGMQSIVKDCSASWGSGSGFVLGEGSRAAACQAMQNAAYGFRGSHSVAFRDCQAQYNGMAGIYVWDNSSLIGCVTANNVIDGINVWENSLIQDCVANQNGQDGIEAGAGSKVANTTASANSSRGMALGAGVSVTDCVIANNLSSSAGISVGNGSVVENTVVYQNTRGLMIGYGCNVRNSSVYKNSGFGIFGDSACVIQNCLVYENSNYGINLLDDAHVSSSVVSSNNQSGIRVEYRSLVLNNTCSGNQNYGILVVGQDNRVDGNTLCNNLIGLYVGPGTGNLIVRNSASGNSNADYNIVAGNKDAEVLTPGSAFVATNPWANFSF